MGEPSNADELMARLPHGFGIRAALPDDKETVLEFCRHTWEWGDYIPRVWDVWLSDPQGRLLVATIDDQPVAIAQVTLLASEEAWLQGFRVVPAYQSRGIATELGQHCIRLAIQLGAKVIRYFTLAGNTPALRIGDKLGFQQVAAFVSYRAESTKDSPWQLSTARPEDLADALSFIKGSNTYKSSVGLYCTSWACHKLTLEKLRKHLNNGEVFILDEMAQLRALAIVTMTSLEQGMVIGYIDGSPDAIRDLASALRGQSAKYACPQIEAELPEILSIQDAFRSAGYAPYPDKSFLVFELSLSK
jgi:GNAT superfamily N-acetyltransferase